MEVQNTYVNLKVIRYVKLKQTKILKQQWQYTSFVTIDTHLHNKKTWDQTACFLTSISKLDIKYALLVPS